MRVNNINNTSFGMKWTTNKLGNKSTAIIKLDNDKTVAISTTYEANNKPLEKVYMLFNEFGDMVKARFKTFFKGKKPSVLTIDNEESIKKFLD